MTVNYKFFLSSKLLIQLKNRIIWKKCALLVEFLLDNCEFPFIFHKRELFELCLMFLFLSFTWSLFENQSDNSSTLISGTMINVSILSRDFILLGVTTLRLGIHLQPTGRQVYGLSSPIIWIRTLWIIFSHIVGQRSIRLSFFGGNASLRKLFHTMMNFIKRDTKKRHSKFTDSSSASETNTSRKDIEDQTISSRTPEQPRTTNNGFTWTAIVS
jgi:hypothetical protein